MLNRCRETLLKIVPCRGQLRELNLLLLLFLLNLLMLTQFTFPNNRSKFMSASTAWVSFCEGNSIHFRMNIRQLLYWSRYFYIPNRFQFCVSDWFRLLILELVTWIKPDILIFYLCVVFNHFLILWLFLSIFFLFLFLYLHFNLNNFPWHNIFIPFSKLFQKFFLPLLPFSISFLYLTLIFFLMFNDFLIVHRLLIKVPDLFQFLLFDLKQRNLNFFMESAFHFHMQRLILNESFHLLVTLKFHFLSLFLFLWK